MAKKRFRKTKAILFIAAMVAASLALQRWGIGEEIVRIDGNKVVIIDGDSFKTGDAEYRIYGIDAPEYRQTCDDANGRPWPCGKVSREGLKRILAGGDFSCDVRARDRFGRSIVKCADIQNNDLGSALVEQGLAISGANFDETIYAVDERNAKKAKRGIWRGSFVRPEIWRSKNPRS